jgi:enoyl-CoA hydratase
MTYQWLKVDEDGAVVTVTLDRPDKRNALSIPLRTELRDVAIALDGRDDVACVLLTGAGAAFSAGADLGESEAFGGTVPMAEARRIVRLGADMCAAWERLRAMTVAVVNGPAIGGGLSLAVACDFRVMAPDAYFLAPEVDLGISFTWNSLPRIGNLVGPARAKLIGALARRIDAPTALAWGLCEEVAPDPMAAARRLAAEAAARPRVSQQMIKEAVNRHFRMPEAVYLDQDQVLLMARDPDNRAHAEAARKRLRRRRRGGGS